ncbi:MAG: membrane protein, partial [Rubrobacter sp.]|nr:membrane protein [Rubrobacter sp.]
FLMVSLWISCGASALLEAAGRLARSFPAPAARAVPIALSAPLLIVPFIGASAAYAEADRSEADTGRRAIEAVAENVEPGATVIHNRSSLWYMVLGEERRRDLTLIDPFHPDHVTTHDLLWPREIPPEEAEEVYETGSTTGVPAALEAAGDGPVYILEQQIAHGGDFTQAGFEVVPVEPGVLYELIPPEENGF